MKNWIHRRGWIVYGLLLLVVLLPRLWQLDAFITTDECIFLDDAYKFLGGLVGGDLSLTLGHGYPAITVAWPNALALLVLFGLSRIGLGMPSSATLSLDEFLTAAYARPLPYYVAGRVATALLVTCLLFLFYFLARHLFASRDGQGDEAALLSMLILSLDPTILGYSRLMHLEVPLALLMLLPTMTWLLWLKDRQKRWLLLTGLLGGLALLTKTIALFLPPIFIGLSLLAWLADWFTVVRKDKSFLPGVARRAESDGYSFWTWWSKIVVGWLIVWACAALVFYILWPAMWQNPVTALTWMFDWLRKNIDAEYGNMGQFWMGHPVNDPGPAFYPVAMLLKLSPFMLIGLVLNLVSLRLTRERRMEWGLWAYAFVYLLAMTVNDKKAVRYLMPAFVAFAPLAGCGFLTLKQWASRRLPAWRLNRTSLQLGFGSLLLAFALIYAPYYLTYYNPLVLGWKWASQVIVVGWGEGLGDAARYLNERPNVAQMTAVSWYPTAFDPFFKGKMNPPTIEGGVKADYIVAYVNQMQRGLPSPEVVTYLQRRQPEHVIRLHGIDYAWIYPAIISSGPLPAGVTPVNVPMGEAVSLEGYTVRPSATGPGLNVTLYWRALKSDLPSYSVYMQAIDGAGQIRARADGLPVMGFWPTSRWKAGRLVADEQVLLRPPETARGAYRLEVGMYNPQTREILEPASGERGADGGLLLGEVVIR
jgi:4-amino-4-deoxy-L-arabinose transferase-like glycosyltransferase